jgi:hypothetical protein
MSQTPIDRRVANLAAEAHRNAYNAAFEELSLSWRWDASTYARLQFHGCDLVRAYLETEQTHLLRAYDADFLVNAIEAVKARCFDLAPGYVARGNRMMQVANDARHSRESFYGVAA